MPYTPHTKEDIDQMLECIGASSVEQLFDEIPSSIRVNGLNDIADGLNELAMSKYIERIGKNDSCQLNFIGAGAYQHHIPAAVWELTGRGEFLTAYTPYQAEASQGGLQIIFEFQTMIASLCGMDIANASMYDCASAFAEAVLMAVRANKKTKSKKILIADQLHPHYIQVARTITQLQGIELIEATIKPNKAVNSVDDLSNYQQQEFAAIVIPQPNFLGQLTEADAISKWAHDNNSLVIAVVNPTAMALIKEPGSWADDSNGKVGADIVCGEGQPLGIPLNSGGPYFGFMCCQSTYVRQMPGRIVGKTTDANGVEGYCLTLQAREQHIRRSKATSNICTNQGLMVTAATIYMSLLGPQGLKKVAIQCHQNTKQLMEMLTTIEGVNSLWQQNFFDEVVIELPIAASTALKKLSAMGIAGGYDLSELSKLGHHWKNRLLICATEVHDQKNMIQFRDALASIIKN